MSNRGEIAERLLAGRPLDHIPVIDFHTHLCNAADYYWLPRGGAHGMLAHMDRFGVDHFVTFPIGITSDAAAGNRYVYRESAPHRDRISALTLLHAAFPDDWIALLEEGARNGARGIKLIGAYQGRNEAGIDWSPALEFGRDRGWAVLNHHWGNPDLLERYARDFPELVFVVGHMSLGFNDLLRTCDNVYQCTCAQFIMHGGAPAECLAGALPPEKVLFGSDALDLDLGTAIGPIALADIAEEDKERILGRNALDIADRLGWDIPLTRTKGTA